MKKPQLTPASLSRRSLFRYTLSTIALSQLGSQRLLTHGEFEDRAMAMATEPHRFLHIFLRGGWDSALSIDPVIGEKISSETYEPAYAKEDRHTVPGKDKLAIGSGMLPALSAFAAMPTAFINGIFVDVTAHPLAQNYALTGRMSLSRTREYPALAALMGQSAGLFPAHIVLGGRIPLGETGRNTPPLASLDIEGMRGMMAEPGIKQGWPLAQVAQLRGARETFNKLQREQTKEARKALYDPWISMQQQLNPIYDQKLEEGLAPDPLRNESYGVEKPRDNQALLLGASQLLRTGLSPYVTVLLNGFDTHSQELMQQKPIQIKFAQALQCLVQDLRQTPDPTRRDLSLADTTTILIGSEFVRTPRFNANEGTDHWKSSSAILMGKGVRDNTIIGQTDHTAAAMGWENNRPVPRNDSTVLLHESIAASILQRLGMTDAQSTMGKEAIHGLFV